MVEEDDERLRQAETAIVADEESWAAGAGNIT
jgi:hypothetical protein